MFAPNGGYVMVDLGGWVSADAVDAIRPAPRVPAAMPMSANRLTVACFMRASVGYAPMDATPLSLCEPSRPHDHCTVPAPNTSAPLAALYIVSVCVAVALFTNE